jgi:hypothetical protein
VIFAESTCRCCGKKPSHHAVKEEVIRSDDDKSVETLYFCHTCWAKMLGWLADQVKVTKV